MRRAADICSLTGLALGLAGALDFHPHAGVIVCAGVALACHPRGVLVALACRTLDHGQPLSHDQQEGITAMTPASTPSPRATRRPGGPSAASAECSSPIRRSQHPGIDTAREAIASAGHPEFAATLAGLVIRAAARATDLRSAGYRPAQANARSVREIDLRRPATLGPIVVATPGLNGTAREIDAQIRSVVRGALDALLL